MADDDAKKDDNKAGGKPDDRDRRPRWPILAAIVVLAIFIVVVLAIIFIPTSRVWTDDAYVQVHYASIAPRISGQISAIGVDDNDVVPAGRELVQLDDRDQLAAVHLAEAQLARDTAQLADRLANVDRQPSIIAQQDSQIAAIKARMIIATANQRRYATLAATGAGSQQDRQQADSQLAELQAELDGARAAAQAARHQLDVLKAQSEAARATLRADHAQLDQAQLNLSYTRIPAPVDGTIAQRSVQVGDYVGPGTTLMTVVPLDRIYIIANYREVALRHVLPGQHVRIHVDAYDIDLDGIVQGIPPSSGAVYSPIPPNNATGNFTKIVQRLPVKIEVSPGQPLARLLRAGFSVETTIETGLADVVGRQRGSDRDVTARP
ncbi:membrane fusion protein (multidrug efflux system) [Endobacter medicaginis]|uniref:Membrane fusion protein (Multidrug efflux system) n=3 Tax=Endobacter medicaginis TaxID=1181271 RepID=A0A839UWR8_9PROT|nr:HlyD family secretion protein [Endobacter medicaginis]MBB3173105.1 membrane fusion protein (multidrug efflux system) [Endobacter medicaginis]MCX5474470.1 HlyD family secretion protein [Endobacter medicaginis]